VNTDKLIAQLGITKDLLLDFLVCFARFEYALKASRFLHQPRGVVEADWHCFMTHVEQLAEDELVAVIAAGATLLQHPPKKLVMTDTQPIWREVSRAGRSQIRFLLESVKRVRNNLFHGGKWVAPPEDPSRHQVLVQESVAVLGELLKVARLQRTRDAFFEPT
jgi:hypothetical protein